MQTKHLSGRCLYCPCSVVGSSVQSGLLCLCLRLCWAGVWKVMQRTGNDLVAGTASKLLFVSVALTQWGSK